MAQKIKVQDGNLTYSATDPSQPVNVTILGELNIGNEPLASGSITTPEGTGLIITSGNNSNVDIKQAPEGGTLTLNGVQWPTGAVPPHPGMFIGPSSLNTLEYYPFVFDSTESDILTLAELNTMYSTIQPGQMVLGPNTIYLCVAPTLWRIISAPSPL